MHADSNVKVNEIEAPESSGDSTTDEAMEPFFALIKRIVESLVVSFDQREPKLVPSIADFARLVQLFRDVHEDDVPSEVKVIWEDPFAPAAQ